MSKSVSAWVKDVSAATFPREVLQESHERPVVVDFWAPWCGPCRLLGPLLEQLAEERAGDFVLAKVNLDQNEELAIEYGVEAIPAVKAFRDGRPVLEFVGLLPEAQLRAFLDRICPSPADRLAKQAQELENTNAAEAEALYRRALEQERDNNAALVGLARLLIARGQDAEASELLERVIPGGEHGAESERLQAVLFLRQLVPAGADEAELRRRIEADPEGAAEAYYELGCVLAARGDYASALEMLLSAAERDRKLATSRVREVMVKIFHIVGVRSPLADEYRDKLTRLLY